MKLHIYSVLALLPALSVVAIAQEAPPAKTTMPAFTAKKKVEIPARSSITFKPIQRSELAHVDKGGHKTPVNPGEMITLKNGRKVKVEDYLASTNELEKRLNALGYSLRKGETLPASQSQVDALKAAQADLDNSNKTASSEPAVVLLDGVPYKKAIAETDTRDSLSGLYANKPGGPLNASAPPSDSSSHKMNVSGGKNGKWQEGVDGFGFYFSCGLTLSGSCSVNDGHFSQSLSEFNAGVTADAGVTLFGQDVSLLHADASYSGSDKTGNVQVVAHLAVVGNTIWQDNLSQSIGYSDGHTWSQSFDSSVPSITIPCSICSIGVQAGVQGSAGVTLGYKLFTSRVDGFVKPFIASQAYFRAGAGIDLGVASADIGVQGNLTLLNDTLSVVANAGIYFDHGLRFKDYLDISNSLYALSGSVSAYASASLLFISDSVTIPIFSWNGLSSISKLYHDEQNIALPWH